MTQKQYVHIKKLLDADRSNHGDGTNIRNNLLGIDVNVPLLTYTDKVYEFDNQHKEYLSELMWLIDKNNIQKFSIINDIKSWWDINSAQVIYDAKGANATTGEVKIDNTAGITADNYAVIVRGGVVLDLRQGTTGIDTDIGFRAASPYF